MAGTYTAVELSPDLTGEKRDLLLLLRDQRELLKITLRNLTDEQARQRSTVSELTLGGLLKHVAIGDADTAAEIVARDETSVFDPAAGVESYLFRDDDTVEHWLAEYDRAGAQFDAVITEVDSLDELIPMPTAPWQPEREWWPVRRLVMHRLRETAHHCGHADIIREALDGQTTMGALIEGMDLG
ncbi:DUF664 domain-containing protein [Gordonia sp. TBRC 11910]|uniref:DUF664 domain-containing protein n=1 Tax=Gordonia asplenii TaxID=2725283 RepID=A0A848L0V5_9ACTN|nr:DUF664 domain-containing protein [Gordonia asplenii]NMO04087.1 DUF664 domain-containing protein [Gordonia asplenii]